MKTDPLRVVHYALGNLGLHKKGHSKVEDAYFLMKEDHCLGRDEPRTIAVRDYWKEQGVEKCSEINREWRREHVNDVSPSGKKIGRNAASK